jgi:alkylation response protein AidB-like acyl-CoA dehydrogenase
MNTPVPFPLFILDLRDRLHTLFTLQYTGKDALRRGMPPGFLEEAMAEAPLSVFIPERFGGRGQNTAECLSLLETCSYESLPLSLTMGINGALFLQPLSRYGGEALQGEVFDRFLHNRALGGLMITEPDFGSDALRMRTSFRPEEGGYRIRGTKHWGGLTGQANFWLLTARGVTGAGGEADLERSISFFVWDRSLGGIEVEEYYPSLGLYMIPYGRSRIDTLVPGARRLSPKAGGVRMLLDLLHRSRLQFPGMAMGFLRRLLDEALEHVRSRFVGGRALLAYDQVRDRLAELQAYTTACAAMCAYSVEAADIQKDCSTEALPANAVKTVITDYMQDAAQSAVQLYGGTGYRLDHVAGRALVDSRPFQIFEGSNDILYQQIAEAVLKSMERVKEFNLRNFTRGFSLTCRAAEALRDALDFSADLSLPQRKMVELGRVLGRVIALDMVISLRDRGYRKDLAAGCEAVIKRQIGGLLASFSDPVHIDVLEDTAGAGSWMGYPLRA